jgi:hypothetical protein
MFCLTARNTQSLTIVRKRVGLIKLGPNKCNKVGAFGLTYPHTHFNVGPNTKYQQYTLRSFGNDVR